MMIICLEMMLPAMSITNIRLIRLAEKSWLEVLFADLL
jgi:hypothetical protein